MNSRRLNWPLWVGFLLSLAAFLSYFLFFVRFPLTRDFPWANLGLFALSVALVVAGIRRAFAGDVPHPTRSRIVGSIVATLSLVIVGLFVFSVFVMARWLPAAHGAPQVGQTAPDFTLADTQNKPVSLSELLNAADPEDAATSQKSRGVLLVFYRGYW